MNALIVIVPVLLLAASAAACFLIVRLAPASGRFLQKRPDHQPFVCTSVPRQHSATDLWLFRSLPSFTELDHTEAVRQLRTVVGQVTQGVTAVGIGHEGLSSREIRTLTYQFLNPARAVSIPEPYA